MIKRSKFCLLCVLLLSLTACARGVYRVKIPEERVKKLIVLPEKGRVPSMRPYVVHGKRYYPLSKADGFVQRGQASWYGKQFHGRRTASGEIFDMYRKSAAHKTLPLGTYVRVRNLSNRKETVARINDRGPFVKGRIIDLSYASANEIDLVKPGICQAEIVALGKEVGIVNSPLGEKPVVEISDPNRGLFTIQVGAFKEQKNALRLADRLKVILDYVDVAVSVDRQKGKVFRVRASKSRTLQKATEKEEELEEMGFDDAFIVSF